MVYVKNDDKAGSIEMMADGRVEEKYTNVSTPPKCDKDIK